MTVLEPGPGMGFFTLELVRRVGDSGRVVAVDVQPRMIAGLKRRAAKAGMSKRVEARLAPSDSMSMEDLAGSIDFTLAFAVVHEMPAADRFFPDVAKASKPGAAVLFVEPAGHVSVGEWEVELQAASQAGFALTDRHRFAEARRLCCRECKGRTLSRAPKECSVVPTGLAISAAP